ncbi:DUF1318 domain-containing protein [Haliangium sp.]|uniref:DUF1318 domain-containing protein n=1 Tax=Haliangium sp. TaxID=2663208 RepID=UPI003D11E7D4
MTPTPTSPPTLPAAALAAGPCLLLALVTVAAGCVSAPDVVLTDQKTALEQQAAGEFRALENDLEQASIQPKGEDMTRDALEAKNPDLSKSTLGEVVQLYSDVRTDAEWIDQLLVSGCVGEAVDGLLRQTPDECTETVATAQLTHVVERSNLHRRQLWRVIREREPGSSEDEVRTTWRRIHLQRVVCDGLVQNDDKSWGRKEC